MGLHSLSLLLTAWTPGPRGTLPPGENREVREMEKVAAAQMSRRRATRGRYRTRGQAAASFPTPATDSSLDSAFLS